MDEDFVTIETFFNEEDAKVPFSFLKSCGIDVMIKKDDLGGIGPHLAFVRGIKLVVRKEDEEEARQLLSESNSSTEEK